MSRAPVVLCVDWQTYVSATAAIEVLLKQFPKLDGAPKLADALNDLRRAHATYLAMDAQIHTPALLRRQV